MRIQQHNGCISCNRVTFKPWKIIMNASVSMHWICIRTSWTRWMRWDFKRQHRFKLNPFQRFWMERTSWALPKQARGRQALFSCLLSIAFWIRQTMVRSRRLIVVPTRELAQQIDQAVEGFAYYAKVTSLAIYGGGSGHDFSREKKALTKGADIIIATPGRFLSHLDVGLC